MLNVYNDRLVSIIMFLIIGGIISVIFPAIFSGSFVIFALFFAKLLVISSVMDFIKVAFDKNAEGNKSLSAFNKIIILVGICILFSHITFTPVIAGAILEIVVASVAYIFM